MDRLELVREKVDAIIQGIHDDTTRKFAFLHTYGVSQNCALLALRRNMDIEIACIAGMLHDIAIYAENCAHKGHAQRSSVLAKVILKQCDVFSEEEICIIINAIALHSDKMLRDGGRISELLKDADVLQHYLYNTNIDASSQDKYRIFYLKEELGLQR